MTDNTPAIMQNVATTDNDVNDVPQAKRDYLSPLFASFTITTLATVAAIGTVGLSLVPSIIVGTIGVASGYAWNKRVNADKAPVKAKTWFGRFVKAVIAPTVGAALALSLVGSVMNNKADCELDSSESAVAQTPNADNVEKPIVINSTPIGSNAAPVCQEAPVVECPVATDYCAADYFSACEKNAQKTEAERLDEDKVYWGAVRNMQSSDSTQVSEGLAALKTLARLDHLGAKTDMAVMQYHGFAGVKQDKEQARKTLEELSIDCGYKPAETALYTIDNPEPIVVVVPEPVTPVYVAPAHPATTYTYTNTIQTPECDSNSRSDARYPLGECHISSGSTAAEPVTYGSSSSYSVVEPVFTPTLPSTCPVNGGKMSKCELDTIKSGLQSGELRVEESFRLPGGQVASVKTFGDNFNTVAPASTTVSCDTTQTVTWAGRSYNRCDIVSPQRGMSTRGLRASQNRY